MKCVVFYRWNTAGLFGFLWVTASFFVGAPRPTFMTELCNPHRLCCRSWPRFAQTATDQSRERWLRCIIKPSLYSQMTEEHEIPPWRADMYFASVELPQFEGLADVLERLTGLPWWLALCFYPAYCISWGSFLAFSPAWKITLKRQGFPKCLLCLQVILFS